MAIIGAVGQAERETRLEPQREGIAKAQRNGRNKGRVPIVRRPTEGRVTPREIANRLSIGTASVRYYPCRLAVIGRRRDPD